MKKTAVVFAVSVFLVAFAFGAMAPASNAALPKVIKCWGDCFGHVEVECCKYVLPGSGGTFTQCEATGYTCAY
jgi:hypothetical protein